MTARKERARGGRGALIDLDVTTPAATVALALMYLHSNNVDIASHLTIPQNHYEMDDVKGRLPPPAQPRSIADHGRGGQAEQSVGGRAGAEGDEGHCEGDAGLRTVAGGGDHFRRGRGGRWRRRRWLLRWMTARGISMRGGDLTTREKERMQDIRDGR